jgi:hypothetical protein
MSVVPSAHAASHGSGGNDAITTLGNMTVGNVTAGTLHAGATVLTTLTATTTSLGATTATTLAAGASALGAITLTEQTTPSTPAADKVVLYAVDVAGVTTLRAKFANGQVIDICDDTP